jgi:hypothetical protein
MREDRAIAMHLGELTMKLVRRQVKIKELHETIANMLDSQRRSDARFIERQKEAEYQLKQARSTENDLHNQIAELKGQQPRGANDRAIEAIKELPEMIDAARKLSEEPEEPARRLPGTGVLKNPNLPKPEPITDEDLKRLRGEPRLRNRDAVDKMRVLRGFNGNDNPPLPEHTASPSDYVDRETEIGELEARLIKGDPLQPLSEEARVPEEPKVDPNPAYQTNWEPPDPGLWSTPQPSREPIISRWSGTAL